VSFCGAPHPEREGMICERRPGNHPQHTGSHTIVVSMGLAADQQPYQRQDFLDWPNESYTPPPPGPGAHRTRLKEMASRVPPEVRLARTDDPGVSHEAIKTYSRTRYKTRLGQVAALLLNNIGVWIDAVRFANEEVGGFAGTRRLRELREEYGWKIETRKHPDPNKPNTHQHCLVEMPETTD